VGGGGDRESYKHVLGGRIRGLRKERGFSQEKFADIAEVDRKHISSIETGKAEPGSWTLMRIAGALEVSIGLLMAGLAWVPSDDGPGRFEQRDP
jgi:transcriptional regulator with XRE-family HTH domain